MANALFILFVYLRLSKRVSWKRRFAFHRLLVFYDNNIESYGFWGLKRENVYSPKITVNEDIENINPEADIKDELRKEVEF